MNCSFEWVNEASTALHCAEYGCSFYVICDYRGSNLPFKSRVKSHLPFAGTIRNSPYSQHWQSKC